MNFFSKIFFILTFFLLLANCKAIEKFESNSNISQDLNNSELQNRHQCNIDKIDDSPLPVQSKTSKIEHTKINKHNDVYIYNNSGTRKLGIRKDWGGSIIFFGKNNGSSGINKTNVIDGNDTGREVQIAMYDNERRYQSCAWNATCGKQETQCEKKMTFLGWNPVQGGNRCNKGSGIDSLEDSEGSLTIKTIPLQWNPNWKLKNCKKSVCGNIFRNKKRSDIEITQKVKFISDNIVELDYKVTNLANIEHKPTVHEFPTLYASYGSDETSDLYRLFVSKSIEITEGWSTDAHGFRYKNFRGKNGWAALINRNLDYGVGLYYENGMNNFQGWNKLNEPSKFNNFRGLFKFGLPPNGTVRARSYLILGSLEEISKDTKWLANALPPFGVLDLPNKSKPLKGIVSVAGWVLDNKEVDRVELIINGGTPIPLIYGNKRLDVCKEWVGYQSCKHGNIGFSGSFDAEKLTDNICGNIIEIKAYDKQGNKRIIARKQFVSK